MSPWWRQDDALGCWLADFVSAEMQHMRPSEPRPAAYRTDLWTADVSLGEGGFGLDSLERMQVAAALSEALHMHRSGVADHLLASPSVGAWCHTARVSLDHFNDEMTMRTSGSSGVAKRVVHGRAALEQETLALTGLLADPVRRILSAVPRHHVYGFLFTTLLPDALGGVPVVDMRSHSPAAVATVASAGDVVVAFPDYWAAAVRAVPNEWPCGVVGVTSTAPMPAGTAEALVQAGLARLLDIHGSTETAGLGWRDNPHGPHTLLPYWERAAGERVRRVGIEAGGGRVAGEAIAPPDRLAWTGERQYRVLGRADGAVQVGGVNVFPARVSGVLGEHPGVAEVVVRLMSPAEGARLKAYIVPRRGGCEPALQGDLQRLAAARLSPPEQPRAYDFGPALPRDSMGKAADWPIRAER